MSGNVKVSGAWKSAAPYVKVSGAWKTVSTYYVKVSGAWKIVNTLPMTATDWGSTSNAAPADVTSPSRAITVPAGNPGSILLTPSASAQYSINGGSYVGFVVPTTITVTNGQTLTLRFPAATLAGTDVTIDVYDNTANENIGSAFLQAT